MTVPFRASPLLAAGFTVTDTFPFPDAGETEIQESDGVAVQSPEHETLTTSGSGEDASKVYVVGKTDSVTFVSSFGGCLDLSQATVTASRSPAVNRMRLNIVYFPISRTHTAPRTRNTPAASSMAGWLPPRRLSTRPPVAAATICGRQMVQLKRPR